MLQVCLAFASWQSCLGYVVDEKKAREAPFLNPQVPRLLAISHGLSARAVASGAPRCVQRGRMRPGNGSLSSADFRGRWKCNSTAVPLRWTSLCHSATLPTFTLSCCCILSSVIDFLCCVVFCCVNTNSSFTHCTVGGHVAPLPFLPFKSEAAAVDAHPCLLGHRRFQQGVKPGGTLSRGCGLLTLHRAVPRGPPPPSAAGGSCCWASSVPGGIAPRKWFQPWACSVGFHIHCRWHFSNRLFPNAWDLLTSSSVSKHFLFFFQVIGLFLFPSSPCF